MPLQKEFEAHMPLSLGSGLPKTMESLSSCRQSSSTNHQNRNFPFVNILYDRRVVKGDAHGRRVLPATAQTDAAQIQRQQEIRRRAGARKKSSELKITTPEALWGRKHIDVQTEYYLQELSDEIDTTNIECQTEAFLDRPSTPLFTPVITGKDVGTQIEEGELFDFDREVQPLLEVLVVKTMEQALLEVMEEEELASLRAQQRAFREVRNTELAEVRRLEELERRRNEEKARRYAQQEEALRKEKEVLEKLSARAFTQQQMDELVPEVFTSLRIHGFLYGDRVTKVIEADFVPWLLTEVNDNMQRRRIARDLLDAVIENATQFHVKTQGLAKSSE